MADVATTSAEAAQSSPKSTVKKDRKKTTDRRPKASHPSTAIMVNNAIQNLKERGGSSLQAIKKYISATYKVDAEKLAPFIKKYLKSSVTSGALVQTKGKGASGSFKLASTAVTKKSSSGVSNAAATAAGRPRKSKSAAKPRGEKKTAAARKSTTTTTTTTATAAASSKATKSRKSGSTKSTTTTPRVAKPKSPSKVKKTTKAPTKKPKSPKPKTTKPKVVRKRATSPKKK